MRFGVALGLTLKLADTRRHIAYLQVAHVVNEHARICAPVECYTQTLETLLSCSVPNLRGCQIIVTDRI